MLHCSPSSCQTKTNKERCPLYPLFSKIDDTTTVLIQCLTLLISPVFLSQTPLALLPHFLPVLFIPLNIVSFSFSISFFPVNMRRGL
jgi:hypothetical protein